MEDGEGRRNCQRREMENMGEPFVTVVLRLVSLDMGGGGFSTNSGNQTLK
jgi:hypothetical protein